MTALEPREEEESTRLQQQQQQAKTVSSFSFLTTVKYEDSADTSTPGRSDQHYRWLWSDDEHQTLQEESNTTGGCEATMNN